MATAKKVMDTAIKYLGVKEYPPDSNNVVFNTDYYGRKVSGNYPWCCAFVWDVFRMAGASSLFYGGRKTAYCPYVETWGKSNGLTVPINSGRYGDIVLFDWQHNGEADHIGFIESQKPNGSYITIEGNTAVGNDSNGGEVMRRIRPQTTILCIIRPKYEEDDKMLSYEEWKKYQERYERERSEMGVAKGWQENAQQFVKDKEISDGNCPQCPAPRVQIWGMLFKFYGVIIADVKRLIEEAKK